MKDEESRQNRLVPISDTIKVELNNLTQITREYDYHHRIFVGNTGLTIIAIKAKSSADPQWDFHFTPSGRIHFDPKYAFEDMLIFEYAFNSWLKWWDDTSNFQKERLPQRPSVLTGKTNEAFYRAIAKLFGSTELKLTGVTTNQHKDKFWGYEIDMNKVSKNSSLRQKLTKMSAYCQQQVRIPKV